MRSDCARMGANVGRLIFGGDALSICAGEVALDMTRVDAQPAIPIVEVANTVPPIFFKASRRCKNDFSMCSEEVELLES